MHIDNKHPFPFYPKWLLKRALSDCQNAEIRQGAFIGVGDTTSRGNEINWSMAESCFKAYPSPAEYILLPLGNHDTWNDDHYDAAIKQYYTSMKNICGMELKKPYFSQEVRGYKIICMGSIGDVGDSPVIGEEQLKWLDEELKDGSKDGKPVFVINHQALNGRHGLPETFCADGGRHRRRIGGG